MKKKCAKDHLKKPPGSSEQNQDPGCLRIEVRGDFNINGTKYFKVAVFHKKSKKHDVVLKYTKHKKKLQCQSEINT